MIKKIKDAGNWLVANYRTKQFTIGAVLGFAIGMAFQYYTGGK